jgi:hypothetical protein
MLLVYAYGRNCGWIPRSTAPEYFEAGFCDHMRPNRFAVLDFSRKGSVPQESAHTSVKEPEALQVRIQRRRRSVDALHSRMARFLASLLHGETSKPRMLQLAERIARERHVKIDRLAKRSKECLICWFCEVAPDLLTGFLPPMPKEQTQEIDRSTKSEPTEQAEPAPLDIWASIDLRATEESSHPLGIQWF